LNKQIPPEIGDELSNLKIFDMSHNNILSYPTSLYKLKLEEWNMSYNKLERVHVEVGNLQLLKETREWEVGIGYMRNLKIFRAAHNSIDTFPRLIERCLALKHIDLSHNIIKSVPDVISELEQLSIVNIEHNSVDCLPPNFYRLSNLTELILKKNNIVSLEDSMDVWQDRLIKICLDRNSLTTIPESIGRLKHLISFSANYNYLEDLPDSFLKCKKLNKISLANNKFMDIPKGIKQLFKVKVLDISCNGIQTVSGVGLMISLTDVNFSFNIINELQSDLFKLSEIKILDVSHNKIQSIPQNVGDLKVVENLNLSFNRIDEIPKSILTLTSLKELYLEHNTLCALPDGLAMLQKTLVRLSLNHNCFKEMPIQISNFRFWHIDASGNSFCKEKLSNHNDTIHKASSRAESLMIETCSFDEKTTLGRAMEDVAASEKAIRKCIEHDMFKEITIKQLNNDTKTSLKKDYRHYFRLGMAQLRAAAFFFPNKSQASSWIEYFFTKNGEENNILEEQLPTCFIPGTTKMQEKNNLHKGKNNDDNMATSRVWLKKALVSMNLAEEIFPSSRETTYASRGPCELYFVRSVINYALSNKTKAINDLNQVLIITNDSHMPSKLLRTKIRVEIGQYTQALRECKRYFKHPNDDNQPSDNDVDDGGGVPSTTKDLGEKLTLLCETIMEEITNSGLCKRETEQTFYITKEGVLKRNKQSLPPSIHDCNAGRSIKRSKQQLFLRKERERILSRDQRERSHEKLLEMAQKQALVSRRKLEKAAYARKEITDNRLQAEKLQQYK